MANVFEIGNTVTMGNFKGEEIEWLVIGEKDGRYLLLSKKILDFQAFHYEDEPIGEGDFINGAYTVDWRTCQLRQWLNQDFLQETFSEEEKAHIPCVNMYCNSAYKTLHTYYPGEEEHEDQIFLLSNQEVERYLKDESLQRADMTENALKRYNEVCTNSDVQHRGASWWLRSLGRVGWDLHVQYIYSYLSGAILQKDGAIVTTVDVGVRPAFWYEA